MKKKMQEKGKATKTEFKKCAIFNTNAESASIA